MIHANPKYNAIQDPTGLIPDDEPVFLLRGTDPCTTSTIIHWLDAARTSGVPPERRAQVRAHMDTIKKYQADHKDLVHVPGTPRVPARGGTQT